ncbi:MAG: FIVAR domain-containing protein [Clostridia bacterium]|nr:FIVAR domain-containing protein [Clostridia bacterium]
MKRTISILVIVAMMLASLLAIVPVSAATPEGTPVKNAKEFAAMEADGTYYLANDITIAKPYADFKGKLDGNGHTIAVNGAPSAFTKLSGATVSNLTVTASQNAAAPSAHVGALAGTANGTFTNVHAVVDYTYTDKVATKVAGLIGEINGATVITGCTAKGSISITFEDPTNSETSAFGGLVAYLHGQTVSISQCVNYVNAVQMRERTNLGGILGQANGAHNLTIDSCANYGVMTSTCSGNAGNIHSGVGGIVGQLSGNSVSSKAVITNSRNYADIHSIAGSLSGNKDKMAGGIVGRIYGSNDVTVDGCVNSGNIDSAATGWGASGGIVGQAETFNYGWSTNTKADIKVNNCINLGKVNGNNCAGIFGSTAQVAAPEVKITVTNSINYGEIDANTDGNGAGMFGATNSDSSGTFTFINCYNAGKVDGAGIMSKIAQAVSSEANDKDINKTIGLVTIQGCINVGEVTTGGLIGSYTGPALEIKASASTFEGDVALAPEGDSVKVTETPEDAAAAAAALLATLPVDPSELDAVVSVNLENEAVDYAEGWDAFKTAFDAAFAVANKASTKEEMDAAAKALNDSLPGLVLNTELDFEELDIAIGEADEYIDFEEDYTPGTWKVFKAAYEAANACAEAERQSQINKAAAALISALDALETKPDFEALDEAMAEYDALVEAEYTTGSWAAFKAALDAAKAVRENPDAVGSQVEEVIKNLKAAGKGLGKLAADDAINVLKAKAEDTLAKYDKEAYTSDSYKPLTDAIRVANDFVKTKDVSQAEIDASIAEIDKLIAALVPRADLTELKALIETAEALVEENYTAESWEAFQAALKVAKDRSKLGNDAKVSVEEGATLKADLEAALAALVGNADFTALDALLAEVKALKEADYTAETWKVLADAITAAEALKANTAATTADVDAALAAIGAAKDALAKASVETDPPATEKPTEQTTEPADKGGCGGTIALGATVVVAILGTAIVLKKKD